MSAECLFEIGLGVLGIPGVLRIFGILRNCLQFWQQRYTGVFSLFFNFWDIAANFFVEKCPCTENLITLLQIRPPFESWKIEGTAKK